MMLISTVEPFSKSYPLWLCDIWGVVHNGMISFVPALQALQRHREAGGCVILISNSPRPKPQLVEQLQSLNVGPEAYDDIISSGDVTRELVKERLGEAVFHLGPQRDKGIFAGLDCKFSDLAEAGYVLCSGLFDDVTETPDDYADLLQDCKTRELPLICANPDLKVQRGDQLIYCAGALAAAYEELGGEVIYAGKPYLPIYDLAVDLAVKKLGHKPARDKILAIGDGVHTDLAGAALYGCDFLFITGGLHAAETGASAGLEEAEAQRIAQDICAKSPEIKLIGISSHLA